MTSGAKYLSRVIAEMNVVAGSFVPNATVAVVKKLGVRGTKVDKGRINGDRLP